MSNILKGALVGALFVGGFAAVGAQMSHASPAEPIKPTATSVVAAEKPNPCATAKALDCARSVYSKFELAPGPGWTFSGDRKHPSYDPDTGYSVWENSLNCVWEYVRYNDFAPKSKGCTARGNMLTLSYHDSSSAEMARNALLQRVKDVVPLIMRNFPEIDSVSIDVYSDFVDLKGNEKKSKMFGIRIDRRTADSTNWPNVRTDNIMKFAEVFWQHNAVEKELGNPNADKDQEMTDRCIRSGFCSRN